MEKLHFAFAQLRKSPQSLTTSQFLFKHRKVILFQAYYSNKLYYSLQKYQMHSRKDISIFFCQMSKNSYLYIDITAKVIINLLYMRVFLLASLLLLVSSFHALNHFDKDIAAIHAWHKAGHTSNVFSIFMKMLVQTKTLYKQLDIKHPPILTAATNANCSQMMEEAIILMAHQNWVENYQNIYSKLLQMQQKCTNADFVQKGSDNGFDDSCALCVVLSRVIENYVTYHRKDVAKFVEDEFCSMFDGLVKPTCEAFVHYAGPFLIKGILNKQNTDIICHGAGLCKDPKCKITDIREADDFQAAINGIYGKKYDGFQSKASPWKWIIDLFTKRFGDQHFSPFDLDNDAFSDISTFRGYHWRGADCNEFDAKVYPGRKEGKSIIRDHDCNAIFGRDEKGASLEDKLCGNSTRLGIAVAGDSAGAHFSIPQKFFNVTMMHKGTFDDLLPRAADQLDLPHESAYTGHTITEYPSHSIYKYLRRWNMCNNNDFQNLGVNGGDSGNSWGNIKALKRDPQTDHPMIFFLQLIGNDVCGSSVGGTDPADFRKNILRLLNWLDTRLPKGSHVFILGLADGDLLFEFLHGGIHPLDVSYDQVYDFLNCLKISPCAGWLNTNATARKYTTELAKNLSKIYQSFIDEKIEFKNYDLVYYDFPTQDIFKRMYLDDREPREMIERCDGFHPSGLFNSYLADWMWFKITQEHPEWIGEQNPHNQEIKKIFGFKDLE